MQDEYRDIFKNQDSMMFISVLRETTFSLDTVQATNLLEEILSAHIPECHDCHDLAYMLCVTTSVFEVLNRNSKLFEFTIKRQKKEDVENDSQCPMFSEQESPF